MRSQLALTLRLIDEGTARALEENRLAQEVRSVGPGAVRAECGGRENVAHGDWLFDQHLKLLSISSLGTTMSVGELQQRLHDCGGAGGPTASASKLGGPPMGPFHLGRTTNGPSTWGGQPNGTTPWTRSSVEEGLAGLMAAWLYIMVGCAVVIMAPMLGG
ncbi:hypothetical protein CRUP_031873 [Coryphaenoides rupestris]|nr:hypothetical protein CRUP_031873 [Coryphaenoides rupestris]